jgi:2-polyprenyl-3-methyl-5-hydroxy-6-metoxy-1,4-benzoquinol methylase
METPSSSATLVKEYYTESVRSEWRRLVKDAAHRLELETTLHFLDQHLPPAGAILDAGGGPGRYTIELARRGHTVTLLDMTPANLTFARRQIKRAGVQAQVSDVVEGTILDLTRFASASFDAVVCLGGPLSHVLDAADRQRAIDELLRVVKPGGIVAVSVMGRLSVLALELLLFPEEIDLPVHTQIRDTGSYFGGSGFTACHFFLPEEFVSLFDGKAVSVVALVGLEGLGSRLNQSCNRVAKNPDRWRRWLETHYATCTHPAVVGMSEHMLILVRKEEETK